MQKETFAILRNLENKTSNTKIQSGKIIFLPCRVILYDYSFLFCIKITKVYSPESDKSTC